MVVAIHFLFVLGSANAALVHGLISYWDFDGTLIDSQGGYATAHNGGTPAFAAGQAGFGLAVDLDGIDDYVDVTEMNQYDFGSMGSGFSVSAWFKVDGFTKSWQAIIAKGEGSSWRLAILTSHCLWRCKPPPAI